MLEKKKNSFLPIVIGISIIMFLFTVLIGLYNNSPPSKTAKKKPTTSSTDNNVATNTNNDTAKVKLWTPPQVDAPRIPISFYYETKQENYVNVNLQFKPKGTSSFINATLLESHTMHSKSGKHTYTITWNTTKDGIKSEQNFDIKLQITALDKPRLEDEIHHVQLQERKTIRNHIQNYLIYYGNWTDNQIDFVKEKYQLVIIDTRKITAEQVQKLRAGKDPHDASDDVLVLGYISVGEDLRTAGKTPAEMKKDAKFVLDGTGPFIDPRGSFPNGGNIPANMNILGKPENGGFAQFYLNDNFINYHVGQSAVPDFNQNFKTAFVNPGHPEWLKTLMKMTLQQDSVSGLKEILNADYGAEFGCDGLFLDTLDTAAPNSFTNASSSNPSQFEWVAKGTQELVRNIRHLFPDKLLLANRGIFFYHPDFPAYHYTLGGIVDFVMYESFRLDSNATQWFNPSFFNDNKYNYAQKLMAEADRDNGFRVLSLGYAEGPEGALAKKALHGEKNSTLPMLLEDIKDTSSLGMIHYITNASLTDINTFVLDNEQKDAKPPIWGSTNAPVWGKPYDNAREGLQKVDIRHKNVYVQWDIAHSMVRPITYYLFIKTGQPFDFNKDLKSQSKRIELPLGPPPADYAGSGDRTHRFPYEARVTGLQPGKTYYLLLRAKNTNGQFDQNQHVIKIAVP